MKLHEVTKNEDGTVRIDSELTADETKALLQLGVMACLQHGVMVASLAPYFGGGSAEVVEGEAIEVDGNVNELLLEAEKYAGIADDVDTTKKEESDVVKS